MMSPVTKLRGRSGMLSSLQVPGSAGAIYLASEDLFERAF